MTTATKLLIALVSASCVAITTGTFAYTYPETFASIRGPLLATHAYSGDATVVCLVAYLVYHLRRVWRMKRRQVSKWIGYFSVAIWTGSALTGLYAQFAGWVADSTLAWAHIIFSIILIPLSCLHGAWGYAMRKTVSRQTA